MLNFETILTLLVLFCALMVLLDRVFWRKHRAAQPPSSESFMGYVYSFFPILLLVLCVRSFVYEPFRIPSQSLVPTLLVGDFIAVEKFAYDLRLPVLHTVIWHRATPQRGDVVVFRWPVKPAVAFIKRVIAVPGDSVSYQHKQLYINGKKVPLTALRTETMADITGHLWPVTKYREQLPPDRRHYIVLRENASADDMAEIKVPAGYYFVMGDNRDDSIDSRGWGFVPAGNIVGRAAMIWLSWDSHRWRVRTSRLGQGL